MPVSQGLSHSVSENLEQKDNPFKIFFLLFFFFYSRQGVHSDSYAERCMHFIPQGSPCLRVFLFCSLFNECRFIYLQGMSTDVESKQGAQIK